MNYKFQNRQGPARYFLQISSNITPAHELVKEATAHQLVPYLKGHLVWEQE